MVQSRGRATLSSVMNEAHRADRHVIDLMLAHVPLDKTEASYNRAQHMARRRELAQAWPDLLLEATSDLMGVVEGRRR